MTPDIRSLLSTFETICREAGLDIVHAFNLATYNASAPVRSRIPDFGRESALGIVVGNTRALWPIFKGALAASAALREAADPLDDYVMSRIATGVGIFAMPSAILWAHVTKPEPMPIVTAQRMYYEAKERAGITKAGGIHALRHAFTTHLLEGGADLATLQRLLGHESVTTTMHYVHLAQHHLTAQGSPLESLPDVEAAG